MGRQWKGNPKFGVIPYFAERLDSAPVGLHQMACNGQPQSDASGGPGPGLVHPVEPLKNLGQVFRGYSRSGIPDG